MKTNMKKIGQSPYGKGGWKKQTILLVDGDASFADTLSNAWSQLHLDDELHIVSTRDEALNFLGHSADKTESAPLAAIVLDPDTTEEETGAFIRELRKHYGTDRVPILFWTRNGKMYEILENRGVNSVLKKPMVLSLIHALNEACGLRVRPFTPFTGGRVSIERNVNQTQG